MGPTTRRPGSEHPPYRPRPVVVRESGTAGPVRPGPPTEDGRRYLCRRLNQLLYHLYKKHHRLMSASAFPRLPLLLDRHAAEQLRLADILAERVHALGGVAVGDTWHAAELTRVPRLPDGAEDAPAMLSRLHEAHGIILTDAHDAHDAHDAAARAVEHGDDGALALLLSQVFRTGERQCWLFSEHLVVTPSSVPKPPCR